LFFVKTFKPHHLQAFFDPFMKKIFTVALSTLVLASGCKKDDNTTPTPTPAPTTMQASGTLSGANEVPVVSTTATGTMVGSLDLTTKVLTYTVTFSGLSAAATSGHLHYGDAKHTLGAVFVPFSGVPSATSGTITGTATLTAMQVDSMKLGHTYVNIHSANHKGDGEIRSTVVLK
jgi:hypothetical protein